MERRTFSWASWRAASCSRSRAPRRADPVSDLARRDRQGPRVDQDARPRTSSQERTIGLLATAVKSDGEMTLVRPDRLRWELKPPDAVTYWIGPEGFAYATPSGGASVGKQAAGRFAPVLGDMLILLGGDLEKLRARYDITIASRSPDTVLHLVPKTDEVKRAVSSIDLTLGSELWTMKKVVMAEANGDKSVITFSNQKRDVPVDPAKMRPPK